MRKGNVFTILLVLILSLNTSFSGSVFFKKKPELTEMENEYFTETLDSLDFRRVDEQLFLEKYNLLSLAINKHERSPEFNIQAIKSKYLIAQILGDEEKEVETLGLYVRDYSHYDKEESHVIYDAFCHLKQSTTEDKTQSECFLEVKKLKEELIDDDNQLGNYSRYLNQYHKILVDYFASNREKTDALCKLMKEYESEDAILSKDVEFFIRNSLDAYESIYVLTEEDNGFIECLEHFR